MSSPSPSPAFISTRQRLSSVLCVYAVSDIYRYTLPNVNVTVDTNTGEFVVSGLTVNAFYSVFGWVDMNGDYALTLSNPSEPCGWYSDYQTTTGFMPIQITADNNSGDDMIAASFVLHSIDAFPVNDVIHSNAKFVANFRGSGLPLLQVWGSSDYVRGYSQGAILAKYIKKHFRFFSLENVCTSLSEYESEVRPWIVSAHNFNVSTPDYVEEVRGMLTAINDSGEDALWIPELNRTMDEIDLYWLNDYGVYPEFAQSRHTSSIVTIHSPPHSSDRVFRMQRNKRGTTHRSRTDRRACSQFCFWGGAVKGGDASGGLLCGRSTSYPRLRLMDVLCTDRCVVVWTQIWMVRMISERLLY